LTTPSAIITPAVESLPPMRTAAPPDATLTVDAVDPAPVVRAPQGEETLKEEVAILSRAGAALRNGNPALALKALDEHRRRFPSGVLVQERSAARVQALCALGRVAEGRAELGRLEKRAPQSPLTARARKACGVSE
jgi:hypothetical protein